MSQEAQQAAIAQYYASLAAMDREGWLEVLTADAVIYDPVGKPPLKVKEGSPKFFDLLSRFYKQFEIVQDCVFIVDRKAAVKSTMQVVAKNDRTAKAEGISMFEFNEQGKITLIESYWDEAYFKANLAG
ncbi:nuclear transport factor 2 family protein [Aliterella atlantica]|uniref:Ketosteroid isomerase n=1 Tax=Aliterella atlantica CENA595 TaxID=1618023 RepID=A0A0D8ZMB4_9CYAN|nr:nuclear transport factor 2 family protein [Aliterella atlantica]KJH69507.1 ketosteroid isomerase [Aliterella atlantica CENA595]